MSKTSKLIMATAIFIVGVLASVVVSSVIHFFMSDFILSPGELDINQMITSLMANSKHRNLFLLLVLSVLTFIVFIFILDNKTYQSKMMKITNKISTPIPAGQNQFGSARWLDKKDIDKVFGHYEITPGKINKLLHYGDKDKSFISAYKIPDASKVADVPTEEITDLTGLKELNKTIVKLVDDHISNAIDDATYKSKVSEVQKEIEQREELIVKIEKFVELESKYASLSEKIKNLDSIDGSKKDEIEEKINLLNGKIVDIDDLLKSSRISAEYAHEKKELINEEIKLNENIIKGLDELDELKKEHQIIEFILSGIKNELISHSSELISNIKDSITNDAPTMVNGTPENLLLSEPILYEQPIINEGGIVLGYKKSGNKEIVYYISDDVHTLVIGATRSGKSRCLVLQTIGTLGLAGESMFISDPKGELYNYTNPFLKRLDYEVLCLDFKNPLRSDRYNYLQPIIDAIDENDIPKAVDATWDITSQLVGEAKGEKIWTNGEASIIAASIIAVVYDNRNGDKRKYQNMTNAYFFIAEMCKTIGKTMPIVEYMKRLPDTHPAKGLIAISEIAPERTRGSFFTAALTTLRLFTNPLINSMSSTSDYDPKETGNKKRAIFVILPDEKSTYYSLAALLVSQHYAELVKSADKEGGRLNNRVNFILDEFGNFVAIPDFPKKLTVGGGRGIRFDLFLQSTSQLDEVYGKEVSEIIKGNCENWIYLQADDLKTLEEISKKLDKYTISSYSLSSNHQKYNNPSSSSSMNLIGRELLTVSELQSIHRPYLLLTSRNNPVIMISPDISKWYFNRMFGLGNKKHNTKLRKYREEQRPERSVGTMELWGIWKRYQANLSFGGNRERESFADSVIDTDILKKHLRKDELYEKS